MSRRKFGVGYVHERCRKENRIRPILHTAGVRVNHAECKLNHRRMSLDAALRWKEDGWQNRSTDTSEQLAPGSNGIVRKRAWTCTLQTLKIWEDNKLIEKVAITEKRWSRASTVAPRQDFLDAKIGYCRDALEQEPHRFQGYPVRWCAHLVTETQKVRDPSLKVVGPMNKR